MIKIRVDVDCKEQHGWTSARFVARRTARDSSEIRLFPGGMGDSDSVVHWYGSMPG